MCAQIKLQIKCALIGPPGVGKTTFVQKAKGIDGGQTTPTLAADIQYLNCNAHFGEDDEEVPVKYKVWDTAGQERFLSFTTTFLREVNVLFVVLRADDVLDEAAMQKWTALLHEDQSTGDVEVHLLASYRDAVDEDRRATTEKNIQEVAKAASLRLNKQVDYHFVDIRALKTVDAQAILLDALQRFADKNANWFMARVHPSRVSDFSDVDLDRDLKSASAAKLRLVPNKRDDCCSQSRPPASHRR